MELPKEQLILGKVIKDFPYPIKVCPYCNNPLTIVNAVHYEPDPHQFKALYLDSNYNCPVFDEGAERCYARVYYSSEDAYIAFWNVKIPVKMWGKDDLYTIYK